MVKHRKSTPTTAPTGVETTGNDRYLVLDFERVYSEPGKTDRKYRYQVYLLPPNTFFEGFGGSRHALMVSKTPSMVVRTRGGGILRDVEYDIGDKGVWQYIIAEGLTHFSTLHTNGALPPSQYGFI